MEHSYREKQYIRTALEIYLKHLKGYNEDDEDISDDEYSEMQDDIMHITDLLYDVKEELKQLQENTPGGGPKLYAVDSNKEK